MQSIDRPRAAGQSSPAGGRPRLALHDPDRPPPGGPGPAPARPFAQMFHEVAARPDASATALRVLTALKYFARQAGRCWPSVAAIRGRCGKLSDGHCRRQLRALEAAGLIRREVVDWSPANATGRIIHLLDANAADPAPRPTEGGGARRRAGGGCAPAHTEEEAGSEEEERESTFNVGVPPGGDVDCMQSPGPPPLGRVPDPAPTPASGPSTPAVDPARGLEAWRLVEQLTRRGVLLSEDPADKVRVRLRGPDVEELTDGEKASLGRLKPEVLSEVRRRAVGPAVGAAATGPPRVREADVAALHGLVSRLAVEPDDPRLGDELARRLVAVLGDEDPITSLATYRRMAGEVQGRGGRRGGLPLTPGILHDALSEAVRPVVRCRGAAFIASIKRQRSAAHARRRGARPGGASGPGHRPPLTPTLYS